MGVGTIHYSCAGSDVAVPFPRAKEVVCDLDAAGFDMRHVEFYCAGGICDSVLCDHVCEGEEVLGGSLLVAEYRMRSDGTGDGDVLGRQHDERETGGSAVPVDYGFAVLPNLVSAVLPIHVRILCPVDLERCATRCVLLYHAGAAVRDTDLPRRMVQRLVHGRIDVTAFYAEYRLYPVLAGQADGAKGETQMGDTYRMSGDQCAVRVL